MKKIVLTCLAVLPTVGTLAQTANVDSLWLEELQEVVVKGVRAQKEAPYAVSHIKKAELQEFSKTGQELPMLFARTPGVIAWSENGLGTGTTYMRIRGASGSRINVTLDGIPLNSAEDQCVFWANMNSYASLLGSVEIQRGVGASTNGDGAFGGNIALSSKAAALNPSLELSGSYGSYNTFNVGGSFTTGLLWDHIVLDGAYHETNTDGYIHGTQGRSGSFYAGLRYLNDHLTVGYKNFGNFERTGQAWNGVTAGNDDLSLMDGSYCDANWAYDQHTGIKTYADLYEVGLGRFNSLYERLQTDDYGLLVKDANGNYQTERYMMSDGKPWKKTTDNFWQNHNILSAAWTINEHWNTTASLHYTHGYGYYDEFRSQNKIKKIGLPNAQFNDSEITSVKRTDWVRKKGLKQDAYGLVWNTNYKDEYFDVIGGLSLQQFKCNHFGYATYFGNATLRKRLMANGDYTYYDSDSKKNDLSGFIKALYHLSDQWDVFGDIQYRFVGYDTDGYNDKFVYNKSTGLYDKHILNIDKTYHFVNPKAGISFHSGGHRAFASVALSNREPERNNFTDNGNYPTPKAESLLDFEAGYSHTADNWHAGLTAYYMKYHNQFVQTGQTSDIGELLTTNIKDSYRMGIELTAGWDLTSWLSLEGNASLSINKIKDFTEYVEDWDDWEGNPDAAKLH